MSLLEHMEQWKEGKSRVFSEENFSASITPVLGHEKRARYIEVDGNGLLCRATLWEDGALELEAVEEGSGGAVIQSSRCVNTAAEMEESLNWWFGEIAIHALSGK